MTFWVFRNIAICTWVPGARIQSDLQSDTLPTALTGLVKFHA